MPRPLAIRRQLSLVLILGFSVGVLTAVATVLWPVPNTVFSASFQATTEADYRPDATDRVRQAAVKPEIVEEARRDEEDLARRRERSTIGGFRFEEQTVALFGRQDPNLAEAAVGGTVGAPSPPSVDSLPSVVVPAPTEAGIIQSATSVPPTRGPTAEPSAVVVALPAITRVALPTRPAQAGVSSPADAGAEGASPDDAQATVVAEDASGSSADALAVQVTQQVISPLEEGGARIIGEATNGGPDTIDHVRIVCVLLDQAGNVVASQVAFSHLHTLAPGQKTPFVANVAAEVSGWISARVEIDGVMTVGSTASYRTLETRRVSIRRPSNLSQNLAIRGEVRNLGNVALNSPTVILAGFDANGVLIAVYGRSPGLDTMVLRMEPGDSAPFEISFPDSSGLRDYYVLAEGLAAP